MSVKWQVCPPHRAFIHAGDTLVVARAVRGRRVDLVLLSEFSPEYVRSHTRTHTYTDGRTHGRA